MMRVEAIAFDLDGTLVDTAGGIAHALNAAFAEAGLPGFDLGTVRGWIGDGPDALIAHGLAAGRHAPGGMAELAARLRQQFDAATLRAPMRDSSVFAGIPLVLGRLAMRWPLAVVSNKPTALARAVLEEAGLLTLFKSVHGADFAPQRKPSPLLIRQAAASLGVPAHALLMVGDAGTDIEAALAAGSHAAWAGWGYGKADKQTPEEVWTLRTPHDLLARMAASTGAAA